MVLDLYALAQQIPLSWEVQDVDQRSEWRQVYGNDVPVLTTVSGQVLCMHRLDGAAVMAALRATG